MCFFFRFKNDDISQCTNGGISITRNHKFYVCSLTRGPVQVPIFLSLLLPLTWKHLSTCENLYPINTLVVSIGNGFSFTFNFFLDKKKKKNLETHTHVRTRTHARTHTYTQIDNDTQTHKYTHLQSHTSQRK